MLQYNSLTNYGVKNVIKINLGGVSLSTGYEFIALEKNLSRWKQFLLGNTYKLS